MNTFEELKHISNWKEQSKRLRERNNLVQSIKKAVLFQAGSFNMTFNYPLTDDELDSLADYGVDVSFKDNSDIDITYRFSF